MDHPQGLYTSKQEILSASHKEQNKENLMNERRTSAEDTDKHRCGKEK